MFQKIFGLVLFLLFSFFSNLSNAGCAGPYIGTNKGNVNPVFISVGDTVTVAIHRLNTGVCDDATNFQWYRNDTLIRGATSQSYLTTKSGIYKASFIVSGPQSMSIEIKYKETTGLKAVESVIDFTIFPNPAHSNITFTHADLNRDLSIDLIDGLGRVALANINCSERISVVDVNDLPRGIYFIRLDNKSSITYKKLVLN